jgi:N-methylhydantoinase A/oxoprolinase/acetone carboxylase beta subunit
MANLNQVNPVLCYTDTGGTFTDTFIVDASGDFVVSFMTSVPNSRRKSLANEEV